MTHLIKTPKTTYILEDGSLFEIGKFGILHVSYRNFTGPELMVRSVLGINRKGLQHDVGFFLFELVEWTWFNVFKRELQK